MPLYEFRCPNCDHSFEELLPMGASAPCPQCGREDAHRKVSTFEAPRHRGADASQEHDDTHGSAPEGRALVRVAEESKDIFFIDCLIEGGDIGMSIDSTSEVHARGLKVRSKKIGVHNEGIFNGPDTVFE